MTSFVIHRVLQAFFVMLAVALIAFSLFRFVGDPVINMAGQDTTDAERAVIRSRLALDQPVVAQFTRYVSALVQGQFGTSLRTGLPIAKVLAERLPATLELAASAAGMVLLLGVPAGIYTALHPRRWTSRLVLVLSLVGVSLPTFLIGILLILVLPSGLDGCLPMAAARWSISVSGLRDSCR